MTSPTIAVKPNTGPVQRVQVYLSGTYTAASDTYSNAYVTMASGVLTLKLGFAPKYAKVTNITTRIAVEWYEGMASATSVATAADGGRTLTTSSNLAVHGETGSGGSTSASGGTAGASTDNTLVLTASGFFTDNDVVVLEAIG
jgi:hypothetical protein